MRSRSAAATAAHARHELRDALGLLVSVWTALALGGALAKWLGEGPALVGSFGLATAVCGLDHATRRARGARRARAIRAAALLQHAGFALAGVALAPCVAGAALALGALAGLHPSLADSAAPRATPAAVLATLLFAPCFEELLYRGRLLPALVPSLGRAVAVAASSVLFALPHLAPLAILGAWLAGLVLGAVKLATGRTADCVALHAGLNAAVHSASIGLDPADGGRPIPAALAALVALATARAIRRRAARTRRPGLPGRTP